MTTPSAPSKDAFGNIFSCAATPPVPGGEYAAPERVFKTMKHRRDAGFSLAALIFFATAVSILLSAAYPAYQMQAKREREEEVIFRGEEYTRAIQKFQRKFGVYPPSVDALVQSNGLRFLRRPYKDPITEKDFRLIYINPDGSVTGSTLLNQRVNNTPLFGAPLQQFGQQPQQPQPQQQQPQRPQQPQPQTQQPQPPQRQQGQPQQPQAQQPFQQPSGGTSGTSGVIGVASDSPQDSIKVYNSHQKYNEWEFIAITSQAGQQPNQPNVPSGGNPPQNGNPPNQLQPPPPLKRQ